MLREFLVSCCLAIVWVQQSHTSFVLRSGDVHLSKNVYVDREVPHSFVILGASGDLAKRKIYPSLWYLYRNNLLPTKTRFYGYSLQRMTIEQLRENCAPFVKVRPGEEKLYDRFWSLNSYINPSGDENDNYNRIAQSMEQFEDNGRGNRIFYMALPPSVFPSAAEQIKRACMAKKGITRVVVEKPFGRDSESSKELSDKLCSLFDEDQIYRMDHYLGKEMVQNLLILRFGNRIFDPTWDRNNIAAVEILFEENLGIEGRGGYFDNYGIIRDVMQNHLLQIISLIAMERPDSDNQDDVRDAKVELLKSTMPIVLDDVVLGQYVGNPESLNPNEQVGYLEDPTVPKGSLTATFALTVLKIENERWRGVPFIIRAGKGLKEKKTEVIVQYRDISNDTDKGQLKRNELVFTIAKAEAVHMKIMSKSPGITSNIEEIELDFTYKNHYKNLELPEAYQRLILDVFHGSQDNFVRTDELSEAWRIFTPVLHAIENKKIRPVEYKFGTQGPEEANKMEKKYNFL